MKEKQNSGGNYRSSASSTSSALDLSGTPAGIASSAPPSPALDTTGLSTRESRRRSWGKQDSEAVENPSQFQQGSSKQPAIYNVSQDDPFVDITPYRYASTSTASSSQHRSTVSLISDEDDEAHLTHSDAEGNLTSSNSSKRKRTVRYDVSPSPLKRTGTAIKSMGSNLRRVSLRVVNLAGSGLEDQIRLPDDEHSINDQNPQYKPPEVVTVPPNSGPLRGRSLGYFSNKSTLRNFFYNLMTHPSTEPTILALIIANAVVLIIQSARSLTLPDPDEPPSRVRGYFHTWEDWALFGLFIIFTIEAFARMSVSGFLIDPDIPTSTIFTSPFTSNAFSGSGTVAERWSRFTDHVKRPFFLPPATRTARAQDGPSITLSEKPSSATSPTFFTKMMHSAEHQHNVISLPFKLSISQAHEKVHRHVPYMRQSWNRIDFVAILSFWINFGLSMGGIERSSKHIGVFRAMSVIRTARLLTITSGTTTIMHSLKTARPMLVSVGVFVIFAMILFSVIGIQSFRGSLRRSCYLDSTAGVEEIAFEEQFCGGYIDPITLNETTYLQSDGTPDNGTVKGYICPLGMTCKEAGNPNSGIQSFDTMAHSVLQVLVIASANGWSPLMYSVIDSEFFISCLFFIICVVVLNFWLMNLVVAVITNTFSAIRAETKKSAFGAAPLAVITDDQDDDAWSDAQGRRRPSRNIANAIYRRARWIFVILALASLSLQASQSTDSVKAHQNAVYWGELGITIAFDFEMVLRFLAALPDWRGFFMHTQTWLDLTLAIGSSIIQIPAIRNSPVYPWFTIFQLMRFYRVILVVPRMKPLLLAVFGNLYGLVNMSLFLILINFLAALVIIQMLRGDLGGDLDRNFGQVYDAFLAMYQVFSSEDWTSPMYDSGEGETGLGQVVLIVIFFSGWMVFANFIVLQMFIAVINENFDVAEEAKREKQASSYWETQRTGTDTSGWLRKLNPYRWVPANPVTVKVENLPSHLVLPMQKALVQDYSIPEAVERPSKIQRPLRGKREGRHNANKSLSALQRLFAGTEGTSSDVPLTTFRHNRQETLDDLADEETEKHLELLASVNTQDRASSGEELNDALMERRAQKADFIRDHPTYDKTFWILSQDNAFRRACQKVVQPARGERIFGTPPSNIAHPIFQLVLLIVVLGGIVVEGIATPGYRREYFQNHGFARGSWFDICEAAFSIVLLVEFFIKVAADGFAFTPNAYVRSIWNILDLLILSGLVVNVTTSWIFIGGLSRLTRSLKALRALRLITLMDIMRTTFQSLIISGAARILDAAVLAILYMIPYAVWGLNIFAGKMNMCNDDDVADSTECINEFTTTVLGDEFGFPIPRVWDNPAPSTKFSFDSFKASLLILFEIVSLEGWIDVMNTATSIVGIGQQPQARFSMANSLFFLIYNLLGGVVILTLFVSIIIGNFSSKTGTAFLTQPQREWIDLQKLFKRQRPSKRPKTKPTWFLRAWCYDRAVQKHGWWHRTMTVLFFVHIIALMSQTYSTQNLGDTLRNTFFLVITLIYIVDVVIRLFGLGWRSYKADGWNWFDIVVAGGSFITTLIVRSNDFGYVTEQLQKLFLVSIAFKLVQRTNSLNKLFKTAVASLPVIVSLLGLWIILFCFFGILFLEVFGQTKWGTNENHNQNYATLGSSIIMLAFMSTGEGWNGYMHDYTLAYPRCSMPVADNTESDCGSVGWSFTLFIAWNLMSMYIFLNLFTGVVVENFSYVFQASAGAAKSITREEMRLFKQTWAEYANSKTGYLERSNFVPFFGSLRGVFEVRIYSEQHSIRNIRQLVTSKDWDSRSAYGVDLVKLNKVLNSVNYAAVRQRRATYSRLYHEATISHHSGRGITFTEMLLLLAHHKLIVDKEALVLKDLVERNETNKLVTDLVNLDRVRSLLKTLTLRRRFLAHLDNKHQSALNLQVQDIPAIVVDSMPTTPTTPPVSRDIASYYYTSGVGSTPSSPTPQRTRLPDSSLEMSPTPGASGLHRASRRMTSDLSMLSTDLGYRFPRDSLSEDDPQMQNMLLSSMQNSMWGDVMSEAMQEEESKYDHSKDKDKR